MILEGNYDASDGALQEIGNTDDMSGLNTTVLAIGAP